MKKLKKILVIFILINTFFAYFSNIIFALDLNGQKNEISQEIKETQEAAKKIEAQTQNVSKEALQAQAEVEAKESQINTLTSEIQDLEEEIEKAEKEAEDLKKSQEKNQEMLKNRLRALYIAGNTSTVELLIKSKNVFEFLSNYNLLKQVAQMDNKLATSAEQQKQKQEAIAIELETKKKSVQTKKVAMDDAKRESEKLKAIKEAEVAKLTEEGKAAIAKIEELKREEQKIAAQIAEYERRKRAEIERQKKLAASKGKSSASVNTFEKYVGGVFAWPVPSIQRVGTSYGVKGRYWSSGYHTGVDVPGPTGTQIVAANDGIVVTAGWNSSYGNYVVIDHGGGMYTLYAHASRLNVSSYQTVKRGQTIMFMGETGNAFGSHLHFEVRKGGSGYSSHVNPLPYLRG